MSYFDHAECPHCGAHFDPERVKATAGNSLACPSCGQGIKLTDLFGLADAFAEEDGPNLSLDDLVSSPSKPTPKAAKPAASTSESGYASEEASSTLDWIRKKRR